MGRQPGREVLIKRSDGAPTPSFITVAGIRAKTISLSAGLIEATDADSPLGWRELLAGAGIKQATVTGSGVFRDAPSDALLRQSFFDQSADEYELSIPDFGVLRGSFVVANLDYSGDHDGEAAFAATFASSGPLTFEAL